MGLVTSIFKGTRKVALGTAKIALVTTGAVVGAMIGGSASGSKKKKKLVCIKCGKTVPATAGNIAGKCRADGTIHGFKLIEE